MLDKKGLTSSEASHIANFLKEQVKKIDITPQNFKTSTAVGIRGMTEMPLDSNTAIQNWKELLLKKGEYYSLSAWLKEAIKYKEWLLADARTNYIDSSSIKDLKELPAYPAQKSKDWEDFFRTELNIKEQAEYLAQESRASHVGGFIHNFDTVRQKIDNFVPTSFHTLSDTETMTVVNTLLYDTDGLYQNVEELQGIHREAEKVVNYWKAKHKEWIADQDRAYQNTLAEYRRNVSTITAENNSLIQKEQSEFEKNKTSKIEEIAALRIVIPIALQHILDEAYEKLK